MPLQADARIELLFVGAVIKMQMEELIWTEHPLRCKALTKLG